jgi:hypothetical protein
MTIDSETYESIDLLEERNEEIKKRLEPALDILLDEKQHNKKEKFGFRFAIQLDSVLRSYGLMTADEVVKIDYNIIENAWFKFSDLLAFYNLYFEIVPNKQMFCAFMRINNRIYDTLEKSNDEDIRALMASINDSFISLAFSSSESGNNASAAALK